MLHTATTDFVAVWHTKHQCKMIRRISILTTAVKMRIMKRPPGWACIRRRYSSTTPDSSEQPCMILRSNACLTVPGMTQTYCTITATEGTASQGVHENTERFAKWSFESSRRHSKADRKNARHTRYIVLRVHAGDGVGPSSFTKRGRGGQMLPMLRGGFGIPPIHVQASGKARQRYLPAVRWKVWRPKIEADI